MVQAALLYTSVSGQRRLRVTNLSLNISDNMGELYRWGIRVNANTNADPHWFQCGFGNGSSIFGQCGSGSRSLGRHKRHLSFSRSLHPSKENIWHLKTWIFFTFVGYFGPPGSGSVFPMRIRIQMTKMNADPDPQHCYRARIFTFLRSARINFKESVPPAYVACRAGTTTLFLLGF